MTTCDLTPGTFMTYGASRSRGHASGVSPLWKTGIISRVHHWYQRTCAARAAAYAAERGGQGRLGGEGVVQRPGVGEGE